MQRRVHLSVSSGALMLGEGRGTPSLACLHVPPRGPRRRRSRGLGPPAAMLHTPRPASLYGSEGEMRIFRLRQPPGVDAGSPSLWLSPSKASLEEH